MFHALQRIVLRFGCRFPVSDPDRKGEGGRFSNVGKKREMMVMVCCILDEGRGREKEEPGRRLLDAGSIQEMGKAVDFTRNLQLFHRKAVVIVIGNGFLERVDVDGYDSKPVAAVQHGFVGEDEALQPVPDVIEGWLEDIDGNALGIKDVTDLVEEGDAEGDFSHPVEFFHGGRIFDEEAFIVGKDRKDFEGKVIFTHPDFLESKVEEIPPVKIGRNAHGISLVTRPIEKAQKRGGGSGNRQPFCRVRHGFFRIAAGCVSQKEEGLDAVLAAGEEIRDFHDGMIRKWDGFDFRKFSGKEGDDFINDFCGNYDTDTHGALPFWS